MAYRPGIWPAEAIQRMRKLAAAGLSIPDMCFILEDEFELLCAEETLRRLMRQNEICLPGHVGIGGKKSVWSEEKTAYLLELLTTTDLTQHEIARKIRDRFGV